LSALFIFTEIFGTPAHRHTGTLAHRHIGTPAPAPLVRAGIGISAHWHIG
jgi:hypothetical protein